MYLVYFLDNQFALFKDLSSVYFVYWKNSLPCAKSIHILGWGAETFLFFFCKTVNNFLNTSMEMVRQNFSQKKKNRLVVVLEHKITFYSIQDNFHNIAWKSS